MSLSSFACNRDMIAVRWSSFAVTYAREVEEVTYEHASLARTVSSKTRFPLPQLLADLLADRCNLTLQPRMRFSKGERVLSVRQGL